MKRVTYWPQAVLGASSHPASQHATTASHHLPASTPHRPSSYPTLPCPTTHPSSIHVHTYIQNSPIPAQPTPGLAFNWGALLGWSAVSGAVHWPVAGLLYAGGVLWTLVYDSIYAHQDKADDARVGIRSTALLFGERTRSILAAFSASSVGCIALAGHLNAHGAPFFLGTGLAATQLARIVYRTDFNDRASCGKGFSACGWAGFWVWLGALGDYVWLQLREDDQASVGPISQIDS